MGGSLTPAFEPSREALRSTELTESKEQEEVRMAISTEASGEPRGVA